MPRGHERAGPLRSHLLSHIVFAQGLGSIQGVTSRVLSCPGVAGRRPPWGGALGPGLTTVGVRQVALRETGPGGSPTCVQALVPGGLLDTGQWVVVQNSTPKGQTA